MRGPEPDEVPPRSLAAALGALRRTQALWLADLDQTLAGDPAFLPAFRRWQELLSGLKLQLHRAEGRLLHYLADARYGREWPDPPRAPHGGARRWSARLEGWFALVRVDPRYRRVEHALDADAEAVTVDILTDIAGLAETAEHTLPALAAADDAGDRLEDLAFYHVIAPWRRRGALPLLDVLRWLHAILIEQDEL